MTGEFIDIMFGNYFLPMIQRPTRVTSKSATCIDNIFTNNFENHSVLNGICLTDITDHFPIFHIYYSQHTTIDDKIRSKRIINDQNLAAFSDQLDVTDWNTLECDDPQTAYDSFLNTFTNAMNAAFPVVNVRCKPNKIYKAWLTKGLLTSIKNKNKLYSQTLTDQSVLTEYKQYKNKLNHLLRIAEKDYYRELLNQNKHNMRKTWKILNKIINKKRTTSSQSRFKNGDKYVTNPHDVANNFNNYFSNIGTSLADKIGTQTGSPLDYMKGSFPNSIFLNPTTEQEVSNVIKTLTSSASGWDGVNCKIIKAAKNSILPQLAHMCNLSLRDGIFPHQLKLAKVVPIFKSGGKDEVCNYRPVSVLPVISKIFEKIIYDRLADYIEKHNILNEFQFGFRKGRSSYMALNLLVDKLHKAIDERKYTVGIFLDLSKAFDTLNHSILLDKLNYYGIRGTALNLIKNYLSDRKQFVHYNNVDSEHQNISCGVPQGSILGPLLFIIYINDIVNVSDLIYLILYADDTNVFVSHESPIEASRIANVEISKLNIWFKINKLSLNVKKTKAMFFSPKKEVFNNEGVNLSINDIPIDVTDHTKFLGVTIDNKLDWSKHISFINNKISKSVGILCKARHKLFTSALISLYNTLVLPYLTYCIVIWGKTYKKLMRSVFILHKKIMRIITFSDYRAHTNELFKKHKVLKFESLYDYFSGILMYKSYHRTLPSFYNDFFAYNNFNHSYNTRYGNDYQLPKRRSTRLSFSVQTYGPPIWNNLPINIKDSKSLDTFKRNLKKHLIVKQFNQ